MFVYTHSLGFNFIKFHKLLLNFVSASQQIFIVVIKMHRQKKDNAPCTIGQAIKKIKRILNEDKCYLTSIVCFPGSDGPFMDCWMRIDCAKSVRRCTARAYIEKTEIGRCSTGLHLVKLMFH